MARASAGHQLLPGLGGIGWSCGSWPRSRPTFDTATARPAQGCATGPAALFQLIGACVTGTTSRGSRGRRSGTRASGQRLGAGRRFSASMLQPKETCIPGESGRAGSGTTSGVGVRVSAPPRRRRRRGRFRPGTWAIALDLLVGGGPPRIPLDHRGLVAPGRGSSVEHDGISGRGAGSSTRLAWRGIRTDPARLVGLALSGPSGPRISPPVGKVGGGA